MKGDELYIGELAELAGTSAQTIRYYEREGLLGKPARTQSGYRLYSSETASRVRFIKKAQALGLSLAEIREILQLARAGRSPCKHVRERLQAHLEALDRRIREMQLVRNELAQQLNELAKLPDQIDSSAQVCQLIDVISLKTSSSELSGAIKRKERGYGKQKGH